MRVLQRIMLFTLLLLISQGSAFKRTDFLKGKHNNVCKDLKDNVLVYAIFVDTQETAPWTDFDIHTTLDSLNVAMNWLNRQARINNRHLNLIADYYIGQDYATIRRSLPQGTIHRSFLQGSIKKGTDEINEWADYIAKRAGSSMNIIQKDGIPEIRTPKNVERLIAYLRDEKQVESVALLFMINNYYRNDISLPVNHLDDQNIEYAIISYKYPGVIAQNILSLFGAVDLYKTIYRKNEKKIKFAYDSFPSDIMQDVYANDINHYDLGDLTKYLIGWTTELDDQYKMLLTD